MSTRTISLGAIFLGLMMTAGCTSAPKLERIGVRIQEITPSAAGTTIDLRFINPNNLPLVVPDTQHTLYLDGKFIGVIKHRKPLGIPPLGNVTESIAVPPPVAKAIAQVSADHPGSTAYVLESTLHLNWDDGIYDYKARDQGSVTLPPPAVSR